MADLGVRERLQPSLLDRLTDEEPRVRKESRRQRILSVTQLREAVLRDLRWLLNTERMRDPTLEERFPLVARSVLNYGLPALAGNAASGVELEAMAQSLRRAILDFEPRLIRDSVVVRASADSDQAGHNALRFEIEGTLWARPLPLALYLKTEVDLERGDISLSESSLVGMAR